MDSRNLQYPRNGFCLLGQNSKAAGIGRLYCKTREEKTLFKIEVSKKERFVCRREAVSAAPQVPTVNIYRDGI